uniref:Uncharacterized protein n=1 Tax=Desertifilum tharense IPPAS B-1220 TaxID=1781255 RepID=A0ACD5GMU8_9CYAN
MGKKSLLAINSALFSPHPLPTRNTATGCASYGTQNFALFSPTSPPPHPPTLFPTQHS